MPAWGGDDGLKLIEDYVDGLGLDAYLVGGVVRDELLGRRSKDADFLVPGLDSAQLQAALAAHGRVEELVVAGRAVGIRLFPRDAALRALAPAGIEFAPLRRERSTGPGRHDFEIVVDPSASVEDDLARRDFTINAIARRLRDRQLVDPFHGSADLAQGVLRAVGPRSFAEDPLRLVRGLRFVSELDLDPDAATLAQMREQAATVRLVSGERLGGGLAADGMGELSKLLLGDRPAKALTLARETGVLQAMIPAFAPAVGFRPEGAALSLDEHLVRVVGLAAQAGGSLAVRLAALLHDLGKPALARGSADAGVSAPGRATSTHAELGALIADETLIALRYPNRLRSRVVALVRFHTLELAAPTPAAARRLLARHGEELARELLDLHEADLRAKPETRAVALGELEAFRRLLQQERESPHRLAELAVDGSDLIALGYRPGAELGAALALLLAEVVEEPARNRRAALLARARELRGG